MKKVFAVVLMVAMLLCSSAFAYESVTVTSGDVMPYEYAGKFCMDIPFDCFVVTYELGAALSEGLTTMTDDEFFTAFGVDKAYATALLEIAPLSNLEMGDVIVGPDMLSNVLVNVTTGVGITPDMIPEVGDMLGEAIVEGYIANGFAAESCMYLGIYNCIGIDYIATYVNVEGIDMFQFVTFNAAGDMIMLNVTAFDTTVIDLMLESMVIY